MNGQSVPHNAFGSLPLFKKAGLHIAFSARKTIAKLLTYTTDHLNDKYEGSGVYQPTCLDCQKRYVGQTGRSFRSHFKEHTQDCRSGNHWSNFAKHLLDHQHTWHPIEDTMSILHISNKGCMLNTSERFHIYKETKNHNQIND
jgi:hypothetical protein